MLLNIQIHPTKNWPPSNSANILIEILSNANDHMNNGFLNGHSMINLFLFNLTLFFVQRQAVYEIWDPRMSTWKNLQWKMMMTFYNCNSRPHTPSRRCWLCEYSFLMIFFAWGIRKTFVGFSSTPHTTNASTSEIIYVKLSMKIFINGILREFKNYFRIVISIVHPTIHSTAFHTQKRPSTNFHKEISFLLFSFFVTMFDSTTIGI